jgi:hypothetical protein
MAKIFLAWQLVIAIKKIEMIAVFNKAKGALKSVPEITTINTANKIATGVFGPKTKKE